MAEGRRERGGKKDCQEQVFHKGNMKSSFSSEQFKYSYHLNLNVTLNKTGILLKTKQNEGQTGSVIQSKLFFFAYMNQNGNEEAHLIIR